MSSFLALQLASLPLMAAGFKWLVDCFEPDNERNTWALTGLVCAAGVAGAWAVVASVGLAPVQPIYAAAGLAALWTLACMAGVRVAYRLAWRRAVWFTLALCVAGLLALQVTFIAGATLRGLLTDSPVLTVTALAVGAVAWRVYQSNQAWRTRRCGQVASWLYR